MRHRCSLTSFVSMLTFSRTKPTLQERALILDMSEVSPTISEIRLELLRYQKEYQDLNIEFGFDIVDTKLGFIRDLDTVQGIRSILRMEFGDMGIMMG